MATGVLARLVFVASLLAGPGCVTPDRIAGAVRETILFADLESDSPADSRHDVVFFLDGAGGGGLIIDWSGEIHRGLKNGGFDGQFSNFVWQTGLGPVVDACASVEYKREKARLLVSQIRLTRLVRPGARVHLIAASAGTSVCVYALEMLQPGETVETVVLLSSALSSSYDLTDALNGVRREMVVFVSPNDALLKLLMPILGTADRQNVGTRVAGLEGFAQPQGDAAEVAYRKLRQIRWQPEWTDLGNAGGHTDCKSPAFIESVVAPLLVSR